MQPGQSGVRTITNKFRKSSGKDSIKCLSDSPVTCWGYIKLGHHSFCATIPPPVKIKDEQMVFRRRVQLS